MSDPTPDEYIRCINRMRLLLKDIMPQIGSICINDYQNLNELCMDVTRLEDPVLADEDKQTTSKGE